MEVVVSSNSREHGYLLITLRLQHICLLFSKSYRGFFVSVFGGSGRLWVRQVGRSSSYLSTLRVHLLHAESYLRSRKGSERWQHGRRWHRRHSALIPIATARITGRSVLHLLPRCRHLPWEDTMEKVQLNLLCGDNTKSIAASCNVRHVSFSYGTCAITCHFKSCARKYACYVHSSFQ